MVLSAMRMTLSNPIASFHLSHFEGHMNTLFCTKQGAMLMHCYAIWLIFAYMVHISVVPERDKRSQSTSKPWFRRAQKPGINRAGPSTLRSALQLHDASAAARCIIVTFYDLFSAL